METRCKSSTKGLCIWAQKEKQRNCIDHFCFWAPVGLLWVNFGFRLRFPENLQHLRWAPVWAPPGLLWVPAVFLWEFTAFEVGSGVGSCGFQRCFYENLQHLRWAPVWALVGSSDVFMKIYSILCGLRLFSGWVPAVFPWKFAAFLCGPRLG